jgi:hypothetical protein
VGGAGAGPRRNAQPFAQVDQRDHPTAQVDHSLRETPARAARERRAGHDFPYPVDRGNVVMIGNHKPKHLAQGAGRPLNAQHQDT